MTRRPLVRLAGAAACAVLAASPWLASSAVATRSHATIQPGSALIRATTRLVSSTATPGGSTVRRYDLFNRPTYRGRIGGYTIVCAQVAASLRACRGYLRFSRGEIVAGGLVGPSGFYRLAILGGTGFYDSVGGEMVVQPLGADVQQLLVELAAF